MEQSGILDLDNSLYMYVLHLIYIPRINFVLEEYKKIFNDHKIRSAGNMCPNQLRINGMMDPNNPLLDDGLDTEPENLDLYAEDMQGPTPFDDCEHNVVVEPVAMKNQM